jgi:hypothetical protein
MKVNGRVDIGLCLPNDVTGQLHIPAILLPRKRVLIPWTGDWVCSIVSDILEKTKTLLPEIEPHLVIKLVLDVIYLFIKLYRVDVR